MADTADDPPIREDEAGPGDRTDPDIEHTNVFFTGAFPTPRGNVASEIAANSTSFAQTRQTAEFYEYMTGDTPIFANVNHDTVIRVFLLSYPKSRKVRVIYSLGYDVSPPGDTGPMADSFIALHGDGSEDAGPPNVMLFGSRKKGCQNCYS